jgi:uncharacterized protein YjeT (DUF2065 family)
MFAIRLMEPVALTVRVALALVTVLEGLVALHV